MKHKMTSAKAKEPLKNEITTHLKIGDRVRGRGWVDNAPVEGIVREMADSMVFVDGPNDTYWTLKGETIVILPPVTQRKPKNLVAVPGGVANLPKTKAIRKTVEKFSNLPEGTKVEFWQHWDDEDQKFRGVILAEKTFDRLTSVVEYFRDGRKIQQIIAIDALTILDDPPELSLLEKVLLHEAEALVLSEPVLSVVEVAEADLPVPEILDNSQVEDWQGKLNALLALPQAPATAWIDGYRKGGKDYMQWKSEKAVFTPQRTLGAQLSQGDGMLCKVQYIGPKGGDNHKAAMKLVEIRKQIRKYQKLMRGK